jgi:ubiquinone/menaquinone biosynthesis C-methylase UbiE
MSFLETFTAIQPEDLFDRVALQEGMHVADMGCGRAGQIVFAAARRVGDRGMVYAVDVVPEVLEHLAGRIRSGGHDNIQTIWSDIESVGKTAVPAGSLDCCFIYNVMSSVNAHQRVLEESGRLLRPGGKMAIVDWARHLGPSSAIPSRLATAVMLTGYAKRLGLVVDDEFSLGGYHYGLVLSKPEEIIV